MRDLAARLYDERLGSSFRQPRRPQFLPMDDDGVPTEPAESVTDSEFVDAPDWEVELRSLEERAARNAARARAIAETTQDAEAADKARKRTTLMLMLSEVAAQLGGPTWGDSNGLTELYNLVRNRTAGEWGTQAVLATVTVLPQLLNTELGAQALFSTPGQMALALGAGEIAEG